MKFLQVIIAVLFLFISSSLVAQDLSNAKVYLDLIDKQQRAIAKDFVEYNNAVAHRINAKKTEALRTNLSAEANKYKLAIDTMPAFQGDKEFRDSSASFMRACYNLLNNEYSKIATDEAGAEKSYDKMKVFLSTKILAGEKLKKINASYHVAAMKFADKYIYNKDAINDKLQQTADVNTYYDPIYLLFFKSYKAESFLLDAVGKKDGNSVEQNKKILFQNAQDGLKQLDTLKSFNGDNSLIEQCQKVLNFYSEESDDKMGEVSDYFPQAKEFQKTRGSYDKKPSHTKQEVSDYKKAVKEYNAALKKFNKTSHKLAGKRKSIVDKWNSAIETFFKKHLPKS